MWASARMCYFPSQDKKRWFKLRRMWSQRPDRPLFPVNIPQRCCHQQFTRYRPLTCPYTAEEITRETGDQNTVRVENGKWSQASTNVHDVICYFYYMAVNGDKNIPSGYVQWPSFPADPKVLWCWMVWMKPGVPYRSPVCHQKVWATGNKRVLYLWWLT